MKNLTLLVVLTTAILGANAQSNNKTNATAKNNSTIVLIVNEKSFHSGDSVLKDDLRHLCSAQLQDTASGKKIAPLSGSFVVTSKGVIWKGNCPGTGDQAKKFNDLLNRTSTGDVVFLDHIEAADKAIVPKQFSFIIK